MVKFVIMLCVFLVSLPITDNGNSRVMFSFKSSNQFSLEEIQAININILWLSRLLNITSRPTDQFGNNAEEI